MYRIITISREYGSGGGSVARIISERLGWRLVDDTLVAEIAQDAKIAPNVARHYDEVLDPWFHRMLKALWRGGYEGSVTRVESDPFDADTMAQLWNQLILKSAEIGQCVIVGRGGQCLLQRRSDAFHVSLHAPMHERVRRIRQRDPNVNAEAEAHERDAMRAAYVQRHFGLDWTDRHLYHLIICSSIGLEASASAILCAAGIGSGVTS
jgi:cytidylate kinase